MPAHLVARFVRHLRDLLAAQVAGWLHAVRSRARAAWAARPGGARGGAILLALGLGALGAGALEAQRTHEAERPTSTDWKAVASLLERDARPGDAVALAPPWLERARAAVPASLPVVAAARLDGEPLPGVRRVWLVAAPRAPFNGWDVELALARRATRAEGQALGGLEVTRFDLREPVLPVAVLAERAPDLAETREAGGQPRACLVLRPRPGEALVRELPATPLGRLLSGHATLLPGAGTTPVRVELQIDGQEAGAVEVGPADGRLAFEIDTARFAYGPHQLTLVASSAGDPARQVCLEALALP